ncbi:MAG: site-specific DNA-methyltransferase [Sandarakinorhabdus sp.]
MPELHFKGKEFVYNHHLTVPFRPLEMDAAKGIGAPRLDGNLIVHGDNLHALKALLPLYAGKVDCIFIDPPYNTGNEGWCYNDNVNSPMIKDWLSTNPVGTEDGLRHDKWACMMWPRLKLLYDLLSDKGSICISIGEDEVARLRSILDEIFGTGCFMASFVWRRRISSSMSSDWISTDHEYVIVYCKDPLSIYVSGDDRDMEKYSHLDESGRYYASMPLTVGMTKQMRPNQWYELKHPTTGRGYWPPEGRVWGYYPPTMEQKIKDKAIIWPDDFPESRMTTPRLKSFPEDAKRDRKPTSTWLEHVGRTEDGTKLLKEVFGEVVFPYPKPLGMVRAVSNHSGSYPHDLK